LRENAFVELNKLIVILKGLIHLSMRLQNTIALLLRFFFHSTIGQVQLLHQYHFLKSNILGVHSFPIPQFKSFLNSCCANAETSLAKNSSGSRSTICPHKSVVRVEFNGYSSSESITPSPSESSSFRGVCDVAGGTEVSSSSAEQAETRTKKKG
jgi:hypothetical protein